ncbi:hypothetical protein BH23ACT6_BH23ACT6_15240 [soil metagenome]
MSQSTRPLRYGLAGVLAFSLLAGCGSDDPEVEAAAPTSSEATEPTPTVESEEVETVTTEPDTALHTQEVALDASVWWTRHRFDLGTARVEPEDGGGYLRVDVLAENVSEEQADPAGSDVWLAVNDLAAGYSADNLSATPPLAKVSGDLEFWVEEDFDLDNAVLYFGELTENYSTVPLNGEAATTMESVEVDPPEAASGDLWTFEPKGVTLQPQDLWSGNPVDAGQAFLVIDMVIALDDSASRPLHMGTGDFSLTLPDGTAAPAPGGGYPGINEAVSPGAVTTEVSMAFNVPLDAAGDYVLTYNDEEAPIQMPFSIE